MGKAKYISAVFVALAAFGLYKMTVPLPDNVEHRHVRTMVDALMNLMLWLLLKLYYLRILPIQPAVLVQTFFTLTSPFIMQYHPKVSVTENIVANVPVLIFRPDHSASATVLYFHGGGFTVCDPWTHFKFTRNLALQTDAVVVSVDYRIAPQHPYPAAIEDALAVTKEIVNAPEKLNLDLRDFFLAGDSAGANLATVVALEFEDKLHIDGVVLLSPWLQMVNLKLPSCQLYNKHFFFGLAWAFSQYGGVEHFTSEVKEAIEDGSHVPFSFHQEMEKYFDMSNLEKNLRLKDMDSVEPFAFTDGKNTQLDAETLSKLTALATNKRAWPFFADNEDLEKILHIPIFIQYAQYDSLRDEAILFAHRIRSLGGTVHTSYLPNSMHAEPIYIHSFPLPITTDAQKGLDEASDFIKQHLTKT